MNNNYFNMYTYNKLLNMSVPLTKLLTKKKKKTHVFLSNSLIGASYMDENFTHLSNLRLSIHDLLYDTLINVDLLHDYPLRNTRCSR